MTQTLLQTVQTNIIRNLKKARDAAVFGVFEWAGKPFDADQVSQTRILGLLVTAQAGGIPSGGIAWRLADNSWAQIEAADVPAIFAAMQGHIQTHFSTFSGHEAAILAMTDPDEIIEYNVEVFS